MKTKGLIFMDFDGVINNFTAIREGKDHIRENYSDFSIPNISYSNIIPFTELLLECKRNDFKIVISSMWKFFGFEYCMNALRAVFPSMLVNDIIIGCTPNISPLGRDRTADIKAYISNYVEENDIYRIPHIAIDDNEKIFIDKDSDVILIKVDPKVGLTSELVSKSVSTLRQLIVSDSLAARKTIPEFYCTERSKSQALDLIMSSEFSGVSYDFAPGAVGALDLFMNDFGLLSDKTILNRQVRFELESSDFNTVVPCIIHRDTVDGSPYHDPHKLVIGACKLDQASRRFESNMKDMRLGSFIKEINRQLEKNKGNYLKTYCIRDLSYYDKGKEVYMNNKEYKFDKAYITSDNTYIIFKLTEI